MAKKTKKKPVWKGQKRNAVGLPLTFTKYILYDNKLVIRKVEFLLFIYALWAAW